MCRFVLFFLIPLSFYSQNLINNGGFDIHARCPNQISQIKMAEGWYCSGSPDLFSTCSRTRTAVYAGLSFVGSLLPYSGDCYAGFIVNPTYKEYLTFVLPEKMRRRSRYCIRFLYARSVYTGLKMRSLGFNFHRQMYSDATNGKPKHKKTTSVRLEDHPGVWTAVSFTFTCRGGERLVTIGSFDDDLEKVDHIPAKKNPKNVRIFNYSRSAYYFIENLELIKLRDGETCGPEAIPIDTTEELPDVAIEVVGPTETQVLAEPFVLQELNFHTNSSEILSSSFDELNELADYLISQPEIHLHIMGHTDNRGSEKSNMDLSETRACAVSDYLVSKGVSRDRLTWKGFGQTRPVADNNTEVGRAKNRRVEFQIR